MNVSLDQLLQMLGAKDVEIFLLKQEIESLGARLSLAETKLGEKAKKAPQ